jgi:hypothetical protein
MAPPCEKNGAMDLIVPRQTRDRSTAVGRKQLRERFCVSWPSINDTIIDTMRCGPRNPRLLAIQQDPAASPGWLLTGSEASQSFVDLGRGQPHVRTLPCNSGTFSQMWEPIAVAAAADEEAGVFMFRQNTTAAVCVALCCVAAGTTFQFCLSPTGVYVCMFNCVSLRAGFGFVQVRIPRRHEPLPRTRPLSNARHGERHGSRAPFSF